MSLARAGPTRRGQPLRAARPGDDAEQDLGLTDPGPLPATRKSAASASSSPPPSAGSAIAATTGLGRAAISDMAAWGRAERSAISA